MWQIHTAGWDQRWGSSPDSFTSSSHMCPSPPCSIGKATSPGPTLMKVGVQRVLQPIMFQHDILQLKLHHLPCHPTRSGSEMFPRKYNVHQAGFDPEHKDLLVSIHSLTIYAGVIHQNDLLQQYCRGRIEHTVDGAEQRGPRFVMKDYYDTGGRQGRAALKFLLNTSRRS